MKIDKSSNKRMRKFKRTKIDLEVKYQPIRIRNQNWYTTVIRGLGTGGICMISLEYLGIGTIIQIQLPLTSSSKIIKVTGEILWIDFLVDRNLYEAGIKFINLKNNEKDMISKHIDDFVSLQTGIT